MQSWGTESKFDLRDTGMEPSKSGVLGLLCAALGIDRDNWEDLEPLTRWKMGVRIEKPGMLRIDYQTAQLKPGHPKSDTAQSKRQFLADADFYVGFESEDRAALEVAHRALRNPHWVLCLGRKAFPPSEPVFLENGLSDLGLEEGLCAISTTNETIELLLESDDLEHSERWDLPVAAFSERRYGPRRVRFLTKKLENHSCISLD